ncbi:MAG TPA: DUF6600 domain-containing protein, partial [Bacillota bacterium]|nr:DUF6600 domain-containing protein [Bacillota bacterium]
MAVVVMAVTAGLLTVVAQTNQINPKPLAEEPVIEDGTNAPALSNPPGTNAPPAKAVRPAQLQLPAELQELVRRAEAGTNEEALIESVRYPATRYPITVDQILYLRDLGISNRVLEALVQYHPLKTDSTNETALTEEETPSGMETNAANVAPQVDTNATPVAPEAETNMTDVGPGTAVDENVFYSALAPYGTWLDLPDYGWAWQPTVVAVNPYWQPYCNDGSWIWSDCGWYWQSYYSWGWAPFHYGRWWRYPRYGWVWRPDRFWGPAWVTWRQSPQFCGWAPLPPGARFQQGIGWTDFGRPVGFHHHFGLSASAFTFVPLNHFTDRFLTTHRLPAREQQTVFNRTTVNNNVVVANQRIVNQGIDPQRVAAAINRPIQPIPVRNLQRAPSAIRMGGSAPAA